ncbi:hypothetical protein [Cyanobacterium sp. uoEpiScrs1]|uniref:hypothetical protein n=1 Tax=Cyanobacterium sp. uoEpiScrs1 TaxID=2976343 RepID=UPI002269CEEC|nr:hypothetical protein [Cyanobacterium sp. uoEpiScrs1]
MDQNTIREKIKAIEGEREFLVQLLNKPDLGFLSVDIRQAIEELDELVDEFELTFSEKYKTNH